MLDPDCVFCKIIQGEIPSQKVFEGEGMLAIYDIKPISPGHTVIFSTNHYSEVAQMPTEEFAKLAVKAKDLGEEMVKTGQADGYNILLCSNEAAESSVPHRPHLHLIPRKAGDNLHIDPRG
ncbi:HIT family protein [Candidatus Daviesbacteria bacterium]|nr:HIT family protein [Candidatus Daviesbacteria bacterium]